MGFCSRQLYFGLWWGCLPVSTWPKRHVQGGIMCRLPAQMWVNFQAVHFSQLLWYRRPCERCWCSFVISKNNRRRIWRRTTLNPTVSEKSRKEFTPAITLGDSRPNCYKYSWPICYHFASLSAQLSLIWWGADHFLVEIALLRYRICYIP